MKTVRIPVTFLLVAIALVVGCSGQEGDNKTSDFVTDTDTGMHTDIDTVTGVDTGTQVDTDKDSESNGDIPTWLIHISDNKLWHIDINTAVATAICDLIPEESVLLPTFQSVTFTRQDDRLVASSASDNSLWRVFLPSCEIVKVGDYSDSNGNKLDLNIPGICPFKEGNDLYGVSKAKDVLVRINSNTAQITEIGPLGRDFGNLGATWVENHKSIYAITNLTEGGDELMNIDEKTGAASSVFELSVDFGSVGMEHHPHNGLIYACTNPQSSPGYESAPLFRVNIETGTVELVGLTGLPGNCDNLGAPFGNPTIPPI